MRRLLPTLALLLLTVTPALTQALPDTVPAATWQTATPESLGLSTPRLEALRAWLKTQDTESMMVVVGGRVVFSFGDVAHVSKIASIRKSVLGILYGKYVINGTVDTGKTVVQLGLEDQGAFLPIETHATLEQLMTARSGIYLASEDDTPKRGTQYPGAFFNYQNWDFNAAGTAFEHLTGHGIYQALQSDLAVPLGMQDFSLTRQQKVFPPDTVHPEYAMFLSTRDLARIGLLMLRYGVWGDKQLVSPDWVRYLTTLVTPFRDIHPTAFANAGEPERWGFGAMWWVWDQPAFPGNVSTGFLQGAYSGMGTGGTFLTVLPARNMVVIHKVDIDRDPHASVSSSSYIAMLSMLENSRCNGVCK